MLHGQDCVEAEKEGRRAAAASGRTYVSPYNDAAVAGGQGTLAVELLMQMPREELEQAVVFVPVGGGGLVGGVAAVLKAASPGIRVRGCQPQASDVMRQSVEAGRVVEVGWQETLSDGTAGKLGHCSDRVICRAAGRLLGWEGTLGVLLCCFIR